MLENVVCTSKIACLCPFSHGGFSCNLPRKNKKPNPFGFGILFFGWGKVDSEPRTRLASLPMCWRTSFVHRKSLVCIRSPTADSRPTILTKTKKNQFALILSRFLNGGRWIRTTGDGASRFTVCPLWPLGKSHLLSSRRSVLAYDVKLVIGVEPTSC